MNFYKWSCSSFVLISECIRPGLEPILASASNALDQIWKVITYKQAAVLPCTIWNWNYGRITNTATYFRFDAALNLKSKKFGKKVYWALEI